MEDISIIPTTYAGSDCLQNARRPAVFLDRDGVLIEDTGYPHDPDLVIWIEGAPESVKRFNDAGWYVFVVTNQSGVARGLYSEAQVRHLHGWMADQLAKVGAHVDAFEYCPHHPEATLPEYKLDCRRRKPHPGMLLDVMDHWPVDRERSFMVGDRETDLAAARGAGMAGHLFGGGDLLAFTSRIMDDVQIMQHAMPIMGNTA